MLRRSFSFFNKRISTKYGERCCRYNQNGQPMSKEKVQSIMATVKDFMVGWKLNESQTQLYRLFHTRNYLMAVQFIKDVAKMDALSTRNCPSFHLTKGELLRVEVYSPPLNGLSQVDFDLAMRINQMNLDEYELQPIEDEVNYRREIRLRAQQRQSEEMQKMLAEQFNVKSDASTSK